MKGMRFYEEYTDQHSRRQSAGTCVAVDTETGRLENLGDRLGWVYEGLAAVFTGRNGPVSSTGVSVDYLREWCKRVSEAEARDIHPRLFEWLDMEQDYVAQS